VVLTPLLIAVLGSAGVDDAELVAQARQAFAEGLQLRDDPLHAKERFSAAVLLYEQLHERGYSSAALHRSQGNAALMAGDLPRAILAYRRGLRHDPADRALQEGRALAREEVARKGSSLGRPPGDDRPPWLPRVGFALWSFLLCLGAYAIGWLLLARWAMIRRKELFAGGLAALFLASAVAILLGLATLYEQRANAGTLVVITRDDLPLRLGNGEAYGSRYREKLPRGAEARLLYQRGDWLQIELSGGEVGWVPVSAVLIDV
jgi:hypothetical protein